MKYALLVLAIAALGCSAGSMSDGTVCDASAAAGINIGVRDSISGALVGDGSHIVAREGTFADSLTASGSGPYGLVFERAGTYAVTVTQTGYKPWTQAGVVVTKGACHVKGVALTALLQR